MPQNLTSTKALDRKGARGVTRASSSKKALEREPPWHFFGQKHLKKRLQQTARTDVDIVAGETRFCYYSFRAREVVGGETVFCYKPLLNMDIVAEESRVCYNYGLVGDVGTFREKTRFPTTHYSYGHGGKFGHHVTDRSFSNRARLVVAIELARGLGAAAVVRAGGLRSRMLESSTGVAVII